jgi:hypothetical protein
MKKLTSKQIIIIIVVLGLAISLIFFLDPIRSVLSGIYWAQGQTVQDSAFDTRIKVPNSFTTLNQA